MFLFISLFEFFIQYANLTTLVLSQNSWETVNNRQAQYKSLLLIKIPWKPAFLNHMAVVFFTPKLNDIRVFLCALTGFKWSLSITKNVNRYFNQGQLTLHGTHTHSHMCRSLLTGVFCNREIWNSWIVSIHSAKCKYIYFFFFGDNLHWSSRMSLEKAGSEAPLAVYSAFIP